MLETGDVIFIKGKGFESEAVRAVTFGKVSHVCIAYDSDTVFETDGSWMKARFALLSEYEPSEMIVFRFMEDADETREKIKALCVHYKGTPYSYWSCFTNFLFSWLQPQIRERLCSVLSSPFLMMCAQLTFRIRFEADEDLNFADWKGLNPQEQLEKMYRLIAEEPKKYWKLCL